MVFQIDQPVWAVALGTGGGVFGGDGWCSRIAERGLQFGGCLASLEHWGVGVGVDVLGVRVLVFSDQVVEFWGAEHICISFSRVNFLAVGRIVLTFCGAFFTRVMRLLLYLFGM